MEILLKRDGSDKTTTNIKELAELLEIASLRVQVRNLIASTEELKKTPKIEQKEVLGMVINEFIKKGEVLNISSAASIEKLASVPLGTFYYNKTHDAARLKCKNGWVTLKS